MIQIAYEILFIKALVLTIFIELTILFLLSKTYLKKYNLSKTVLFFGGSLTSFSTLPYLWFILPYFLTSRPIYIITGEIAVVIVEACIYCFVLKTGLKKALVTSLICNLVSFLIGWFFPFV